MPYHSPYFLFLTIEPKVTVVTKYLVVGFCAEVLFLDLLDDLIKSLYGGLNVGLDGREGYLGIARFFARVVQVEFADGVSRFLFHKVSIDL